MDLSTPMVTGESLINALLPFSRISRLSMIGLCCSMSCCCSAESKAGSLLWAMVASAMALVLPCRMTSVSARSPNIIFNAPIMMDLPAPVCPVSMFSPGPNSTSSSSIKAKSFMYRLRIISVFYIESKYPTSLSSFKEKFEKVLCFRL